REGSKDGAGSSVINLSTETGEAQATTHVDEAAPRCVPNGYLFAPEPVSDIEVNWDAASSPRWGDREEITTREGRIASRAVLRDRRQPLGLMRVGLEEHRVET